MDMEDTPPAIPATRALPVSPTPATLPDQADLRPAGPARRWTWLLGGVAGGAGGVALVLGLTAALTSPPATVAASSAAPRPSVSSTTSPAAPPPSVSSTTSPAVSATGSPTALYTHLVDGCSLLRPATVTTYVSGAKCQAHEAEPGAVTSGAVWQSSMPDTSLTDLFVGAQLDSYNDSVYQELLATDRSMLSASGQELVDDRPVNGLGDKATIFYSTDSDIGQVNLVVLQRNALVTIMYEATTMSGYAMRPVPQSTAESAAIACARDALTTLS
ncbi:hypothetical protein ABH930_006688 [Kitasatospora sp. GAS204A]|uniref:hypothetical protein n=1 Tax=unclassified Kitasatospora TaxID=2633591 RepID=UPI00247542FD|nr:hypothetical protein [Kitasatospora sp. GAS204B]MDH6122336.1 hypothetical protein [Kitasatospora sp. GAS204B]